MFLLTKSENLVSQVLAWMLIAGLAVDVSVAQGQVVDAFQNQPQFFVIDGRQPLPQSIPFPLQQALIAISQANLSNLIATSPAVSQVLIPANTHNLSPVITPVSTGNVLISSNPPIPHAPAVSQVFIPTNTHPLSPVITPLSTGNVLLSSNPSILHASSPIISQIQTPSQTVSGVSDAIVSQTLDTSSSLRSASSQPLSQTIPSPSNLLSTLIPIPNVIGKAISDSQLKPDMKTSSSNVENKASLSLSLPLAATSQPSNIETEASSIIASLPSSSVPATLSTPTTTLLSDVTEGFVTISSLDNETFLPTTESIDATSQIVFTTIASADVTEETSASSTVETNPEVEQSASASADGTSSSSLIQQTHVPSTQFSARAGLTSDSGLSETPANNEQEEATTALPEELAADQEVSSGNDITNKDLARNSIMPSAQEVTANRLATMARSRSSPNTPSLTTPSSTSTTTSATTTTTTTTTTTPAPVPSTAKAGPGTERNGNQGTASTPIQNNLNSIATVFRSISRAAARNVAKLAELARTRSQGFGVEPILVGGGSPSPEGA